VVCGGFSSLEPSLTSFTNQVRHVSRVRELETMLSAESDPNRRAIIQARLVNRRFHTRKTQAKYKKARTLTGQVQRLTNVADLEALLAAEPRFDPNRRDIILARIAELTDARD
jgi:hypothetical protein